MKLSPGWAWTGAGLVLLALFFLSLFWGSVTIPPGEVLKILLGNTGETGSHQIIITDFRLPRSLTAIGAGASLALCGLLMQTLFRNALAGPYVLGVSSGASLGVALVLMGGGTSLMAGSLAAQLGVTGAAIAGSAAVMALVVLASLRIASNTTLLILGLMFGYLSAAVVNFLLAVSEVENLQQYVMWTLGNFSSTTLREVWPLLTVTAVGTLVSLGLAATLDALLLGENAARALGVQVKRVRYLLLVLTSLMAGAVTAYCGPIAFLGLAVPHLCRGITRSTRHMYLIPLTVMGGGSLALVADMLSRWPGAGKVLPLNSVTAIIGSPVIIFVILRKRSFKTMARS